MVCSIIRLSFSVVHPLFLSCPFSFIHPIVDTLFLYYDRFLLPVNLLFYLKIFDFSTITFTFWVIFPIFYFDPFKESIIWSFCSFCVSSSPFFYISKLDFTSCRLIILTVFLFCFCHLFSFSSCFIKIFQILNSCTFGLWL